MSAKTPETYCVHGLVYTDYKQWQVTPPQNAGSAGTLMVHLPTQAEKENALCEAAPHVSIINQGPENYVPIKPSAQAYLLIKT